MQLLMIALLHAFELRFGRRLRYFAEGWHCARISCVAAAGAEWRMGLMAECNTC